MADAASASRLALKLASYAPMGKVIIGALRACVARMQSASKVEMFLASMIAQALFGRYKDILTEAFVSAVRCAFARILGRFGTVQLNLAARKPAGQMYLASVGLIWQDPVTRIYYKCEPETVSGVVGAEGRPSYKTVRMDATENALVRHGGRDRAFKWMPGVFVVLIRDQFGVDSVVAHGYRCGMRAHFVRHMVEGDNKAFTKLNEAMIFNPANGTMFEMPAAHVDKHLKKHISYTGSDLASAELPAFFWARTGIKTISAAAFACPTEGPVFMVTYADAEWTISRGVLQPQSSEDKKAGRIGYTISTEAGFSGSPVFQMVNGAAKIVAVHICGSIDNRPLNFGVVVPEIRHFRKELGDIPITPLLTESRSPADRQADRYADGWSSEEEEEDDAEAHIARQKETEEMREDIEDLMDEHPEARGERKKRGGPKREETRGPANQCGLPSFKSSWSPCEPATVPSGSEPSVERITSALAFKSVDLAEVQAWSPEHLLASQPFARYREYLKAGEITWGDEEVITHDKDGAPVLTKVGASRGISGGNAAKNRYLRDKFKQICADHGLELDDYVVPGNSVENIMDSLKAQISRHGAAKELPPAAAAAFAKCLAGYEARRSSYVENVHDGVDHILDSLDGEKSSGWSSVYRPGPKSVWKTTEGRAVASYLVRCRLLLRLAWGSAAMSVMTPKQMVEAGLQDPRVPFVKGEPHGKAKQTSKRWRLIWVCSVVDILAAGITHRRQDKVDINSYQEGFSGFHCVGMGHHDEGVEALGNVLDRIGSSTGKLASSDVQGWDFGVRRQWLLYDGLRRIRLGPGSSLFDELVWCEQMSTSAHVLSVGGFLYQVLRAGITASGVLSTSSQNSFIRSLLEILCGAEDTVSQGDDNVSSGSDPDQMREYGVLLKDCVESGPSGPVDFTSHRLTKTAGVWSAEFLNFGKMMARLEFSRAPNGIPPADALGGCLYALRNNAADMQRFNDICAAAGWSLSGIEPVPCQGLE